MEILTERQKLLLTLVIHDYIRNASPVGSQILVERYRLDMSSATVRNDLAALTEMGYLRQPHTSAGRVPTEEGYRFFVGRMIQDSELPANTRRMISHQFYQMSQDVEQWMRLAASVLAHQSRAASLVTAPRPEQTRVKHLELIATRGRQVLMVLVMAGGEIHQRMLTLSEPLSQEVLSNSATRLTADFQGKEIPAIQALRSQFSGLDQEVLDWVLEEMRIMETDVAGEIYLDGLTNVLAEPEFSGGMDARKALHVLEERSLLQDLLSRTVLTGAMGGVQVLIGGEGTWDELRSCSVVLARYGSPGIITGTLGVLGPMRMAYGRTISTVRFMSTLLSDLVTETMGG
jgi:heat-inducible transcriptional repressor